MSTLPDKSEGYAPTCFSSWSKTDGILQHHMLQAKHLFIGYRLSVIPYYDETLGTQKKSEYIEAIGRQKNFLDTVKRVLLDSKKDMRCVLDLRLQNDPSKRTLTANLILRIIPDNTTYYNPENLKRDFAELIPSDYELEALGQHQIEALLHLGDQLVIELRKKLSFPKVGSVFYEETSGIAPRGLQDWDMKTRYMLPMSNFLEPHTYNLASLYERLQSANDRVQLRISLASRAVFEVEKNLAQQYYYMLHKSSGHLKNPAIENGLKAYSKYLGQTTLYSLKIQVASTNEFTAMATANTFSGQLMHGENGIHNELEIFSLEKYDRELVRNDWEHCNHVHHFQSNAYAETTDGSLTAFMKRLPYLCNTQEAISAFRLPIATAIGIPGLNAKQRKPFYLPNTTRKEAELIQLGEIITSNRSKGTTKIPYGIPIKDLTKHGLIVGTTGSGKTNTTLNFIQQLLENGIPFLIIEPVKSEYYEELKPLFASGKLNRFTLDNPWLADGSCNPNYLRFNPLIPMKGISVTQHISYVKSCITAAFPMHGAVPLVLEQCLYELYNITLANEKLLFDKDHPVSYYHDCKEADLNEEQLQLCTILDLGGLQQMITEYLDNKELFSQEDQNDFGTYLKRRFEKLLTGSLGNALCPDRWLNRNGEKEAVPNNLLKAFTEPTIIELESLADNEDKSIIMAFLLTYLFEFRQTKPGIKSLELRDKKNFDVKKHIHITIIEEAHRLLGNGQANANSKGGEDGITTQGSQSKSISLFVDMMAEIRAKGEGIFIVEQAPTKLVSDVIKNSNFKLMHRINSKEDR
ncbi:DUF87 domain-containing protein, partial [Maribacter sp.]|nr:DUF87 domain-containing protein [Maribacter sp.]